MEKPTNINYAGWGDGQKIILVDNYMNKAVELLWERATQSLTMFQIASSLKIFDKSNKLSDSPKIIFDVGACVGLYSLHIAKLLPEAKIYSFEPVVESYKILKINMEANRFQNIIPINKGLYSKKTTLEMSLPNPYSLDNRHLQPDGNPGLGRYSVFGDKDNLKMITPNDNFIKSYEGSVKKVKASFTTVDEIVSEYDISHVDILKIDCEGSEELILKSSPKFFKSCKVIIAEHHSGFDPNDELAKILENLGFASTMFDEFLDRVWVNLNWRKND